MPDRPSGSWYACSINRSSEVQSTTTSSDSVLTTRASRDRLALVVRPPDIQRRTHAGFGPSGIQPEQVHRLCEARGTNVWNTVDRVRTDINLRVILTDGASTDRSMRLAIYYGIMATASEEIGFPDMPDQDPYNWPTEPMWMEIGLFEPQYGNPAGATTDTFPAVQGFRPQRPIDTHSNRRFPADMFITVWLHLYATTTSGDTTVFPDTHLAFVSSVVFKRREGT